MCIAHTRAQSLSVAFSVSPTFSLSLSLIKISSDFYTVLRLVGNYYLHTCIPLTRTHTHTVVAHWRTEHRKHLKMSFKIHAKFHSFDSQQQQQQQKQQVLPALSIFYAAFIHTHANTHSCVRARERACTQRHAMKPDRSAAAPSPGQRRLTGQFGSFIE